MEKPINPEITEPERAEIAFEHVRQTIEPGESIFTFWSEFAKVARDKFAKWKPSDATGDPKRVTKVSLVELRDLEKQGKLKIYSPDDVYKLIEAHGSKKAKKQLDAIKASMIKHNEFLIEGEIPGALQSSLK